MIDWNWYFAALAQSAAAIVGIFSAFIITKILSNQIAFSEKSNRSKEILTACEKVIGNANYLPIDWYNTRIAEEQVEVMQDILGRDDSLKPEDLYWQLNFSKYQEKSEAIVVIKKGVDDRLKRVEAERSRGLSRKAGIFGAINIPDIKLTNTQLANMIQETRREIQSVEQESKHQIRVVQDCLDTVRGDPESSAQITVVLILVTILFYVGVIYPLSFLPVPANSSLSLSFEAFWPLLTSLKGVLLGVVSLVFTAILLMFFWLNLKLRYPAEIVNNLERFTKLSKYSEYFEIKERNSSGILSLRGG